MQFPVTRRRDRAILAAVLCLLAVGLAGTAGAVTLRRDTFFPVTVGRDQRLAFTGCRDTLVLTAGDVARFRWDGTALWLADPTGREVRILPRRPCPPPAPARNRQRIADLRRSLGDPPRVRELLGGRTATVPDSVWFQAYRQWTAERDSLAERVRRLFREAAPADRPAAATACRRRLEGDPLVVPGSATVLAPADPLAADYVLTYQLAGLAVRSLIDLSRPSLPSPTGDRRVGRSAALHLHHLLWRLLAGGRPYRIELGHGLVVRLQGKEKE